MPSHTPILSRSPARDLALLLIAALAVNTPAAFFVSRPGYMDAYYYFGGALQLARGRGFTEPYVWNYLDSIRVLPHPTGALPPPSHLYWMPLTSLVAAPFIALAGPYRPNAALFRAAQVPFVLLASLLPLLSYAAAALTTGLRRHALAAGLLTIFTG